ncbi:MAG: helix-turn-helix transcriptional regulator [Blastocatellia bacterium]|nr:helix-turn-helix transcriptional regulator [Blastocatellia bacterium]
MTCNNQQCLIVRPFYSLTILDTSMLPTVEQIHFEHSVLYLLRGSFQLLSNNQLQGLQSPNFAFVEPAKAYLIKGASEDLLVLLLRIKRELILSLAKEMSLDGQDGELFFLKNSVDNLPQLNTLFMLFYQEVKEALAGESIVLDSIATQVVVFLLRHLIRIRKNQQLELSRVGIVDRRLRRAIEYIHAHYNQDLPLSEIAQAAFLSDFHFSRLFKKVTGLSPHSYVAVVRVEQARNLLAQTDLSIVAISAAVGYSSQSHFTKVFKGLTGFTPAEYRDSLGSRPIKK